MAQLILYLLFAMLFGGITAVGIAGNLISDPSIRGFVSFMGTAATLLARSSN